MLTGEVNPCYNSKEVYAFEGFPESDYLWNLSGNIADSASIDNHMVEVLVPQEQFNISVTPVNRCGTANLSDLSISPLITPPNIDQVMGGDTIPCTTSATLFWVEDDSRATQCRWCVPCS